MGGFMHIDCYNSLLMMYVCNYLESFDDFKIIAIDLLFANVDLR